MKFNSYAQPKFNIIKGNQTSDKQAAGALFKIFKGPNNLQSKYPLTF
jgi:hypothetical protein